MLIRFHVGVPLLTYLRDSEYVKKNKKNPEQIKSWFPSSRIERIPLGYLYGLVDELEIPEEELEAVCGRDPFTPTESELESWSRDKKRGVGKLLNFYIGLRHAMPTVNYIREVSYPVTQEGLRWGTVHGWFMGNNSFRLKHLRRLVDELKVPADELEMVCGRDPFTPTEDELEKWNKEKGGVGKLLEFYINLNHGLFRTQYLESNSEYVRSNNIPTNTLNGWFSGNSTCPEEHLEGLAEEIGVPPELVKRVTEVDLDDLVVDISREKLEEMRMVQENSVSDKGTKTDKGISLLLEYYIRACGDNVTRYLRNSEYVNGEEVNPETINVWMRGRAPFCLKHMKGLVEELGVNEEYLHLVAGRDPFSPTEGELEEWCRDKKGLKELFAFYVELNYGSKFKVYLRDESEYSNTMDVSIRTILSQFYNKSMSSENLKGFADEIGVPPEYVERISGVKLEQKVLEISREELEEMRKVQESSVNPRGRKTDRGIGMLLDAYIEFGYSSRTAFLQGSYYVKEIELDTMSCYGFFNGSRCFHLRQLKGFVDELGVSEEYLHFVAGRNPFEPTDEELDSWSRDKKGVKELFAFYIELNYDIPINPYLRDHSEYSKSNKLNHRTVSVWMYGNAPFPQEHLKAFADEIGVPPEQVKRVSGIDISDVRSAGEELDEAFVRYLDD